MPGRSKGLLALKGQDKKYVFQGVHEQIQWYPTEDPWEQGEERVSKMVFIGRCQHCLEAAKWLCLYA